MRPNPICLQDFAPLFWLHYPNKQIMYSIYMLTHTHMPFGLNITAK